MSFGCSSEELKKLLNAKKFENRIINTQRGRLRKFKNDLEKWSFVRYSRSDPQTLIKNWATTVT